MAYNLFFLTRGSALKNRSQFEFIAFVGLLLIMGVSAAQGQSGNGALSEPGARRKPRVTAALMFSGGEHASCQTGNINDAYVVTISVMGKPKLTTYISSGAVGCVILPLRVPIGTQISIAGVLQDTDSVPGKETSDNLASATEDCFNVEGYSVGLAANSASEFDPASSNNIINAQGYGFFWYDSDSDLKPGPYGYNVAGCSGHDCPIRTDYYNTDSFSGPPPPCTVLNAGPTGG
jgi:hypothetical protein